MAHVLIGNIIVGLENMYPTLEEMLRDIQYRIRYLLDPSWGDLFEFTRGMMRTLKIRLPQWMGDSDDSD